MEQEGVVQFNLTFIPSDPPAAELIGKINSWRQIFYRLGLIGQDPDRYGGLGFGNVSIRVASENGESFLVSGTQTGGIIRLNPEHYAIVTACDPASNHVVAKGAVRPSSESLTHGALYRMDRSIGAVIHAHSPEIWHHAVAIGIPSTPRSVPYGTPEMAEAVGTLLQSTETGSLQIFAMGGHEDGIVSFGRSIEAAGMTLIRYLARAIEVI
jgi:hypothetical protein